jgi:hypothetical protein
MPTIVSLSAASCRSEMMDWWIDSTNQKLVGNPEHGGQWMAEVS